MAIYRNIQVTFWTDPKVMDDFTPEDKYFYLYLLTNPHTNTSGCYELSLRQMSIETGYSKETIERLIIRFALVHKVIRYNKDTKEVLLVNWHKYNWTTSDKLRASVLKNIGLIKTKSYKAYLLNCFENNEDDDIDPIIDEEEDTEPIEESRGEKSLEYILDFSSKAEDSNTKKEDKPKKKKATKHRYGEYMHVSLTDEEYERLVKDYGEVALIKGIKKVDEYCQESGKSYKDYNLTLRRWGIETPKISNPDTSDAETDIGQVRRKLQ